MAWQEECDNSKEVKFWRQGLQEEAEPLQIFGEEK